MKKALIALLVILIVLSASAFILIPKELTISKVTVMRSNESLLSRYLSDKAKWRRWWPSQAADSNDWYSYNGFNYHLSKVLYHEVEVKIQDRSSTYNSKIVILPIAPDSVAVKWETTFQTSSNPITRFFDYRTAISIKKSMADILEQLKTVNEKGAGLYAYQIHRTTIKDTFLVASKIATTKYPTTKDIYDVVAKLRQYVSSQGAKETNYPMLNVTTNDSIHYTAMIAIPTDRRLEGTSDISFKQMIIYKDKTVTAEVKGGPGEIKKAYDELNLYMNDYILSAPVIHWESLVTDRSKETDSTKWITKIFMPIV